MLFSDGAGVGVGVWEIDEAFPEIEAVFTVGVLYSACW